MFLRTRPWMNLFKNIVLYLRRLWVQWNYKAFFFLLTEVSQGSQPRKQQAKGQAKSKLFFKANVSSKTQTNRFDFTTMIPQVNLFLFVVWRKLKTPKRYFEINWPFKKIRHLKENCLNSIEVIFAWTAINWESHLILSNKFDK